MKGCHAGKTNQRHNVHVQTTYAEFENDTAGVECEPTHVGGYLDVGGNDCTRNAEGFENDRSLSQTESFGFFALCRHGDRPCVV